MLKSRDITLPTKVHIVKAMVFPVVIYGYDSWILKNSEPCKELMPLNYSAGKDLRVPWTERRSNQSILSKVNP